MGEYNGERVRLLKGKGVKVDAAGGRVTGSPWSGGAERLDVQRDRN